MIKAAKKAKLADMEPNADGTFTDKNGIVYDADGNPIRDALGRPIINGVGADGTIYG